MVLPENIKSGDASPIGTNYAGTILTTIVIAKHSKANKIAKVSNNAIMAILEAIHHAGLIKITS
jgi:hypothetical protein